MNYYVCTDCFKLFESLNDHNNHNCPKAPTPSYTPMYKAFENSKDAFDYIKKGESGEV